MNRWIVRKQLGMWCAIDRESYVLKNRTWHWKATSFPTWRDALNHANNAAGLVKRKAELDAYIERVRNESRP